MKNKKKFFCMLLLISIAMATSAQNNMVINPGFESNTGNPTALNMFNLCTDWSNPTPSSPDYFTTLGSGGAGVPNNCFATGVNPHQGDAYAGIITYATSSYCATYIFREYLMGRLSIPMNIGTLYHVSFWVHSPTPSQVCQGATDDYYTNNIGVAFVPSAFTQNTTVTCDFRNITGLTPIYPTPNNFIQSINGWTQIAFNYTATNTFSDFIIGNFEDNPNTQVSPPANPNWDNRAYYFVDDVSIVPVLDCNKCVCETGVSLDNFTIDADGVAGGTLNVSGSPLQPVTKFRITLVNYHSNVDPQCLRCETAAQETFGTITNAPPLYGTNPIYAPYDLSIPVHYSREVTWCFEPEVNFPATAIGLDFRFPPVDNLPCCQNDVSFCLRIEFWNKECKACDRLICFDDSFHVEQPRSLIAAPEQKTKHLIQENPKLKVIPNPASNNFRIEIDKENLNGTLQIFDLNGSLIMEAIVSSEDYIVNTKSFAEGLYLLRYKTAKGSFEQKVVIKK